LIKFDCPCIYSWIEKSLIGKLSSINRQSLELNDYRRILKFIYDVNILL